MESDALTELRAELVNIKARLDAIARQSTVNRLVYVGDGRVLLRSQVSDLIYLVESGDLLFVPRFMMDGVFEPEVTNYFVGNVSQSDHCVDVGANFGYYTCIFGRFGKRTVSIEANEEIFQLLRNNIHINWLENNIKLYNAAASNEIGELTLYRRLKRAGNTSIIHIPDEDLATLGEAPSQEFKIPSLTVDSILPSLDGKVDVLKVDVEGAEPLVFAGARETIARNRNIKVVMEWSPSQMRAAGFDLSEFGSALAGMNLQFGVVTRDGVAPVSWSELMNSSYHSGVLLTHR